MFVEYNANPKGKLVGDCVKRAICTVEERDYMEVGRELNRLKRELNAKSFSSDKVWKEHVKRNGYKKHSFQAVKGQKRMNGERFTDSHKKGSFILNMANHLVACVDGVIYDTWDCTEKCVYTAFELK